MAINVNRIVTLSETVKVDEEVDGYTGFAIARIANETLKELDLVADISPHAVYNDAHSGRINGRKYAAGELMRYTENEVEHYVAKLVAKKMHKNSVVQELPEPDQTENRQDTDVPEWDDNEDVEPLDGDLVQAEPVDDQE
jgi:hypothetical protein